MSNIADRVAAAFEALQGRIVKRETENARLWAENDGLKNRVQILEGLRNAPPDRVQLDEHQYIVCNGGNGWLLRGGDAIIAIKLTSQTNEIINACLGYKP